MATQRVGLSSFSTVNPDTIGCVWTGEFHLNTLRVGWQISKSAKNKQRIERYPNTCGRAQVCFPLYFSPLFVSLTSYCIVTGYTKIEISFLTNNQEKISIKGALKFRLFIVCIQKNTSHDPFRIKDTTLTSVVEDTRKIHKVSIDMQSRIKISNYRNGGNSNVVMHNWVRNIKRFVNYTCFNRWF